MIIGGYAKVNNKVAIRRWMEMMKKNNIKPTGKPTATFILSLSLPSPLIVSYFSLNFISLVLFFSSIYIQHTDSRRCQERGSGRGHDVAKGNAKSGRETNYCHIQLSY